MADENVKKAQIYLNSMYGHRNDWEQLEENGYTGTLTIAGIIRAFQIENGLDVVGEVGPATLAKFKALPPIQKMDPSDPSSANVCLLQCALFCKGYAAGGITGIYYTSGVNAVRQLQSDANIGVTGIVTWKVWSALLSFNWFTEPDNPFTKWDPNIRTIQRQLNADYADYINVRACDGIMSRETALSVLGALQAKEGILSVNDTLTNLNELNFGPQTQALFPEPLKVGNSKTAFNKLVQYGLYFNGYHPGNFNGVFDAETSSSVAQFQEFYALTTAIKDDIGTVGTSTMMSLLTSRGDTSRPASACDCSTILNQQQVNDLSQAGYKHIGRYLTGTVGNDFRPKALTVNETKRLIAAGIAIFPIYQDGGYYLDYFKTTSRGASDASIAITTALRLGFSYETTIYFAVDFDCLPHETEEYIVPYFTEINAIFNTSLNTEHYKVGVYGPRQICAELFDRMMASSSFVSDMSSGFTGNCGYPLPQNWAFDQFWELKPFHSSPSFDLDKVAVSTDPNKDKGCSYFTNVTTITDIERMNALYRKNISKFCMQTANIKGLFSHTIDFSYAREQVGFYQAGNLEVNTYIETATTLSSGELISIDIPSDLGENESTKEKFRSTIKQLLSTLDIETMGDLISTYESLVIDQCIAIAVEMGNGKIVFSTKLGTTYPNSFELAVAWECDTLHLSADGENGQSYTLSQRVGWILEVIIHPEAFIVATKFALAAACAVTAYVILAWFFPAAANVVLKLGEKVPFSAIEEHLIKYLLSGKLIK